jgi:hypothetical protein
LRRFLRAFGKTGTHRCYRSIVVRMFVAAVIDLEIRHSVPRDAVPD